jgi:hypothetical protein
MDQVAQSRWFAEVKQELSWGASTLTISGLDNPATLEVVACRKALALAQDLSLSRVCVASDCLEVIRNLQQPYMGAYSIIVDEIKETKTLFSSVSFRHEGRSNNGEAHRLARSAVSLAIGRQLWLLEPPEGLCIPVQLYILDEERAADFLQKKMKMIFIY